MIWEMLKTAIQEILNIQDDSELTESTTFVDDLGADSQMCIRDRYTR